jgi:hypothetical protein
MERKSMTVELPASVRMASIAMQTGENVLIYEDHHSISGRVVKIERVSDRHFEITTEE